MPLSFYIMCAIILKYVKKTSSFQFSVLENGSYCWKILMEKKGNSLLSWTNTPRVPR